MVCYGQSGRSPAAWTQVVSPKMQGTSPFAYMYMIDALRVSRVCSQKGWSESALRVWLPDPHVNHETKTGSSAQRQTRSGPFKNNMILQEAPNVRFHVKRVGG